ncbi:MAG: methyltransferase domain-containing protein [Elusimicrobia bacterium]|nr:methyltransferase domain-containing protein [Elusimicrobiota bacterium]
MNHLSVVRAAALASLLGAAVPALGGEGKPSGDTTIYWNNDLELIVKTQKLKASRMKKVVELMGLRPGMVVVDIGAGSGQATLMMARAMSGRGEVFATEIDPKLVEHIGKEAASAGLANVRPALVRRAGLDEFYSAHRFDRALLYHVIANLKEPVKYLQDLRRTFAPGGRLFICDEDLGSDLAFRREDFSDYPGFLAALEKEPPGSPLRSLVLERAKANAAAQPADTTVLGRAALFHLNEALLRADWISFFLEDGEFSKDVRFTPEELDYARWRLHRLRLVGVPDKRNIEELPLIDHKRASFLNKLLVIQRFRSFLASDGRLPYWTGGESQRWLSETQGVAAMLKNAGYDVVETRELPPFQRVWIAADGARPAR